MKAWIAVFATAAALSVVTLAPATADHKPNCGQKWVETGYFFSTATKAKKKGPEKQCWGELNERGKYTYGSQFVGLEKKSAYCKLEQPGDPYGKYWCVCAAEACWKTYIIKNPGDFGFQKSPSPDPPGTSLRVPSRPPSAGFSGPGIRRR